MCERYFLKLVSPIFLSFSFSPIEILANPALVLLSPLCPTAVGFSDRSDISKILEVDDIFMCNEAGVPGAGRLAKYLQF
jgi:hypothetical protein